MQKWEYLEIHRGRQVTLDNKTHQKQVSDWTHTIWLSGSQSGDIRSSEKILNLLCELGDQGWELVTSHSRADFPYDGQGGITTSEVYIFKRPKE